MSAPPAAPATPAPFAAQYTPELPELLARLRCSLAVSTYQAGKVLLVSSDGEKLHLLPRTFDTPMGMAVEGKRLAVACKQETVILVRDAAMGPGYPRQPATYDTLYLPRQVLFTGAVAIHDMAFTEGGLIGVNTAFSCLCRLDAEYSFTPLWRPPFVSDLQPEDRCHLNGMALERGAPAYVSALGDSDSAQGWRERKLDGGVLIDVRSNQTVLAGLPMPHSPRLYDDDLYLLLSASGELVRVDRERGSYQVVRQLPGFVRGLERIGDYLFVGLSRLRKTHTFGDLALARRKDLICGFEVIHLHTGALVSQFRFLATCEEIYDVRALPGLRRPGILGVASEDHRRALSLPGAGFWALQR